MVRKYKAIKIAEHGFLTDEKDDPVVCPVRGANCTAKCAWFSAEDKILRCQDTIIGALRGRTLRSFRLHSGPEVYDVDESLTQYGIDI
jgi:sulfur transfer complex TusBCD TusB component (DsrH family)